jgi:hypothetical protein
MKHTLEQQLYEKEKKSKPNPAKAAQVTPTTTEKSDIGWVYGSHIPGSTHNIFKAATPTNDIFIIALFGTI